MGFTETDGKFHILNGETLEPISSGISIISKKEYSFSTDTVLLASFSTPKEGEICADFGSGCGAIPFIWLARSDPALIYAVEIQKDACSIIERSANINGFSDKIKVMNCNIKDLKRASGFPYGIDLISCNPPYTENSAGVQSSNSRRMTARHEISCPFKDIAGTASSFLRWGGTFCCCMRPERLCSVFVDLRKSGLEPKRLRFVQHNKYKPPFLFLLQSKRGGRPGLKVEPALFITSDDGSFSEEMRGIYGNYMEGKHER